MPTTHPLQLGGERRRFYLLQTTPGSSRPRGVPPRWSCCCPGLTRLNHSPAGYGSRLRGPSSILRQATAASGGGWASRLPSYSPAPLHAKTPSQRTDPLARSTPRRPPHPSRPEPRSSTSRETLFPSPTALYLLVGCGELLSDHGTDQRLGTPMPVMPGRSSKQRTAAAARGPPAPPGAQPVPGAAPRPGVAALGACASLPPPPEPRKGFWGV